MPKNNDLIEKLKLFGFSEYESKAFLAIIKEKKASAPDLAKVSKIPPAKIYGVLDDLYIKGFVGKDEDSKPTIYFVDRPIKKFKDHIVQFTEASASISDSIEESYETTGVAHKFGFYSTGNYRDMLNPNEFTYIIANNDTLYDKFFGDKKESSKFYKVGGSSNALIAISRHRMVVLIDKDDRVQFISIENPLFGSTIDQLIALFSVNRTLTTEMNDVQELEDEKVLYIDSIHDATGAINGEKGILWISDQRFFVNIPGKGKPYSRNISNIESCRIMNDGRLEIIVKGIDLVEEAILNTESDPQIVINLIEFIKSKRKRVR